MNKKELDSKIKSVGLNPNNPEHVTYVTELLAAAQDILTKDELAVLAVIAKEGPVKVTEVTLDADVIDKLHGYDLIATVVIGYEHDYYACTRQGFDLNRVC